MTVRSVVAMIAALLCTAATAGAEVTRVEVTSRSDIAFAGYEKIVGRVYFAVDPANPRNTVVADLDKAPRNGAGRVEFSADFSVIRPKSGGNGVVLIDVPNRGNPVVNPNFNRTRGGDPDVGDGFLLRRGFTIAAIGWEFDLPASDDNRLRIDVPIATDAGRPIAGVVRASFTPDRRNPTFRVGDLAVYAPVDPMGPDSTLTVRDSRTGAAETIPRDRWTLAGAEVTLTAGFEPGRIYEVSFRASNPPIGGLGFVAVRDFATWIKHDPAAITSAKHAYGVGRSQTGRFLRTFLYHGFNSDERGRQVLDAVIATIAGAAGLDLNLRWATPTTASAMATAFPFTDRALRDPVSGVTEGVLDNARARQSQPKVLYSNTGVEYWSSSGRAAALIHSTPDGARDLPLQDNVRSYFFAGAQHGPSAFPPPLGSGQHRVNPTDYWWSMRALLVALDRWVREDVAPPPSQYPRRDRGTLVDAGNLAFPAIPGVASPRALSAGARVVNTLLPGGAGAGTPLPLLVPQVDRDGNEIAGIRLPEMAVPLATYTSWNFRSEAIGGTHQLFPLIGSYIPLPRTRAEREERRDPRQSIEERYPSRDVYLSRIRDAAAALVRDRYLLAEDVDAVVRRATDHWELATRQTGTPTSSR